jgi:hypothetical protein
LDYPSAWVNLTAQGSVFDDPRTLKRFLESEPVVAKLLGIDLNASAQKIAKQYHRRIPSATAFQATDANGDGDNVGVTIYDNQEWWTDLDEYRAGAKFSTSTTDGKILSVSETRVGDLQAFMHLERYKLGRTPVIFGHMEIEGDNGRVVAIDITVDAEQRQLAEAILASVRHT